MNENEVIFTDGCNMPNLKSWFSDNEYAYKMLREKGWKPEDARQVLPIATRSQIVVGANIREWRHIFTMRCDKFAHWEIRSVMLKLLKWCQENVPVVFDDFEFFETDDGKEYARSTPSYSVMKDNIQHFINGDEGMADELIMFIKNLEMED